MRLTTLYLNQRLELFRGAYTSEEWDEFCALSRLYNRFLGPVTTVSLHRPDLLDFSMYTSSCNHSPMSSLMPDLRSKPDEGSIMLIPAGGKGAHMQQCIFGALGEMAERLLATLHFQAIQDELEWATYDEITQQGRRALGPEELPLFAPEQFERPRFPYVPFRSNTRLRWIEASDLLTGEPILLPAQLVLLYYKRFGFEASIGYSTTGGLAFHSDRRRAILHALYEIIERDAVNVCWYCRIPPLLVDVDLGQFLATHWDLGHARLSTPFIDGIHVFLNTLDLRIPIFTAVATDNSRQDRGFLGSGGAWSNRERALAQALFELGQTREVLNSYRPGEAKRVLPDSPASEMTDFLDGAVYFGYKDNLPRLSWYTAGERVISWDDVPSRNYRDIDEEYEGVLSWLQETGVRPLVMDFNAACWPGVFVTKVFVPQLTAPCVAAYPYLGHPRYFTLPHQLGMSDHDLEFGELNTEPIPFP